MKRIIPIDALRGYMLVNMTVDHLLYEPFKSVDFILNYSCQSFGFVSAAEGFYFLSGLVAGMVFGGMILGGRLAQMQTRAFKRAREIYLTNLALFLILTVSILVFKDVFHLGGRFSSDLLIFNEPLQALGLGAVFLNLPYLLEILPLYFFFLLITPLVLKQTAKGRAAWILIGALVCWGIAQTGVRADLQNLLGAYLPADLGYFDILAWQLIFVTGLVIGYHKRCGTLPGFLVRPPKSLTIIAAVLAAVLFAARYGLITLPVLSTVGYSTSITYLGPLRFFNFALLAYLIFALVTRYGKWFEVRWLAYLGQHSLYVFAFHVLLYYGLKLVEGDITALPLVPKLLFLVVLLASLTIPAWVHQKVRTWYRGTRAARRNPPATEPASAV